MNLQPLGASCSLFGATSFESITHTLESHYTAKATDHDKLMLV